MKKLEKILNIIILHLCRLCITFFVSTVALIVFNLFIDDYFFSGMFYGIVFWKMLEFTKDKINLNNR